jgi:hypothetical protein
MSQTRAVSLETVSYILSIGPVPELDWPLRCVQQRNQTEGSIALSSTQRLGERQQDHRQRKRKGQGDPFETKDGTF